MRGRNFAYADAHRYRLGTRDEALPVNAPKCPVHHYHEDGATRFFRNDAGNPDAYCEPNSLGGPAQAPEYEEPPLRLSGDAARYDHRAGNDDHAQARALFRLFDAAQRDRLTLGRGRLEAWSRTRSDRGCCTGRRRTRRSASR